MPARAYDTATGSQLPIATAVCTLLYFRLGSYICFVKTKMRYIRFCRGNRDHSRYCRGYHYCSRFYRGYHYCSRFYRGYHHHSWLLSILSGSWAHYSRFCRGCNKILPVQSGRSNFTTWLCRDSYNRYHFCRGILCRLLVLSGLKSTTSFVGATCVYTTGTIQSSVISHYSTACSL